MRSYNELGIDGSLDWPCIRKLMVIGLLAGCMVMASDTSLGWGTRDSSEAGLEPFLSCYLTLTDGCIFWSALLGLIGIPTEGLCMFAIYRLIASRSLHYAYLYQTGFFGYLISAAAACTCRVWPACLSTGIWAPPKTLVDAGLTNSFGALCTNKLFFTAPGIDLAGRRDSFGGTLQGDKHLCRDCFK